MKHPPSLIRAGAVCVLAFHSLPSIAQPAGPVAPATRGDPLPPVGAGNGDMPGGPTSVSIKEEVFSLPLVDASNLLHDIPSDRLRYARLREMLAAGKARLEKLVVLRTKSGQRAVFESVHELRYLDTSKPCLPVFAGPRLIAGAFPTLPPVPTAFEVRNVGDTLELEPVVGPDEMTIDLSIVTQSLRYLGDRTFPGAESAPQPIIEMGKITTTVSVRDGQPYFLGTAHPSLPNGFPGQQKEQRVWLQFLTGNLVRFERAGISKRAEATLARAGQMRIPKVEFRDASVLDAVEFLQRKSVEIDPAPAAVPGVNPAPLVPRGIRFLLKGPLNRLQTKVTLSLKDVSLLDAAREVATRAAFILEPEDAALIIRAAGENP